MIRLKDILLESKASEKAKKLGLKHTAFGRYADSSGKVVARSVKGELVPVKGHEGREKVKRPAARNVVRNHKQHKIIYRRQAALDKAKELSLKGGDFDKSAHKHLFDTLHPDERLEIYQYNKVAYKTVSVSPEGAPLWNVFRPVNLEWRDIIGQPSTTHSWPPPSGSTAPNAQYHQPSGLLRKQHTEWYKKIAAQKEAAKESLKPALKWRTAQPLGSQDRMMEIQSEWQDEEQSRVNPIHRRQRNKAINRFFKNDGTPPKIRVHEYLERGMKIKSNEIEDFLANFKVGESIVMPPAGYSADSYIARGFAKSDDNSFVDDYGSAMNVSVILRLKPKSKGGEVIGLPLSGRRDYANALFNPDLPMSKRMKELRDEDRKRKKEAKENGTEYVPEKDAQGNPLYLTMMFRYGQIRKKIDDSSWSYGGWDTEYEVMRPGNVSQKVLNIQKKIYYWNADKAVKKMGSDTKTHQIPSQLKGEASIYYIIELEEEDMVEGELVKEGFTKASKKAQNLLTKYVNSSIHSFKNKKESILKKYMNTSIRGRY